MPSPSTDREWSPWYNMDRPWMGGGDIETLQAIEEEVGPVCGRRHYVESSQCKLSKIGEVFTELTASEIEDKLHVPCTDDGLLCLNADQNPRAVGCNDYAVRFLCVGRNDSDVTDTKNSFFPQFDVRIYIILAVVPILIFLIRLLWAFLFRRRRRLRRQARRQRNHQGNDGDSSSISSSVAHNPPSYRELFGELGTSRDNAIFSITRSNIPVCVKCKVSQCCVAKATQSSAFLLPQPQTLHGHQALNRSHSMPSNMAIREHQAEPQTTPTATGFQRQASVPLLDQLVTGMPTTISTTINGNSPVTITATTTNTTISQLAPTSGEAGSSDATSGNMNNSGLANQNSLISTVIQIDHDLSINVFQAAQTAPSSTSTNAPGHPQTSFLNSHEELVLSAANTSNSFYGISQPCPCACHRTVAISAARGNSSGYHNAGFCQENETTTQPQFAGMHHHPVPGLQRVWSNISMASTITLSELPSYEDALDLIKKREQKQIDQIE